MKRDKDVTMLDLEGKPFDDKATVKTIAFVALSAQLKGDTELSTEKRLQQFQLLQKVSKGGVVDLTAEEIAMLKDRATKCVSLIALGRFVEALEKD